MTGPEHYLKGEQLLAKADAGECDVEDAAVVVARAQAHFTAALAAATALNHGGGDGLNSKDWEPWNEAAGAPQ